MFVDAGGCSSSVDVGIKVDDAGACGDSGWSLIGSKCQEEALAQRVLGEEAMQEFASSGSQGDSSDDDDGSLSGCA
eukprot:357865-Karenia_brevis.AAC.1